MPLPEVFPTDTVYILTKYVHGYCCSIMYNGKRVTYENLIFKNNITLTFGS